MLAILSLIFFLILSKKLLKIINFDDLIFKSRGRLIKLKLKYTKIFNFQQILINSKKMLDK